MYEGNDGVCPLLGVEIPFDKAVVDHQHKLKSEEPSVDGKGLCRNALDFRANSVEGKITNAWKRLFGRDTDNHPCTLPEFLRNLADYLEAGPYVHEGQVFVHPTEVKKAPKLKKSSYNKVKKAYETELRASNVIVKPFTNYPKSKKMTKVLEKMFNKYNITPEFYGDK